MDNTHKPQAIKVDAETLANAFKNSPSVQKHLEESRRLFSSIPKEQLDKMLKR